MKTNIYYDMYVAFGTTEIDIKWPETGSISLTQRRLLFPIMPLPASVCVLFFYDVMTLQQHYYQALWCVPSVLIISLSWVRRSCLLWKWGSFYQAVVYIIYRTQLLMLLQLLLLLILCNISTSFSPSRTSFIQLTLCQTSRRFRNQPACGSYLYFLKREGYK